MISTENPDDSLALFVAVRGIDQDTMKFLSERFDSKRGGADPTTLAAYLSIPVRPDDLTDCLAWISTNVQGRYAEIEVGASVHTKLSWAAVTIAPDLLSTVSRFGAVLKIVFSSPVAKARAGV